MSYDEPSEAATVADALRQVLAVERENRQLVARVSAAVAMLTEGESPASGREVVESFFQRVNWQEVHERTLTGGGFAAEPKATLRAAMFEALDQDQVLR